MKHDIEENLGLIHPQKGLEKDQMPGAADRNKFRDSLNNSEKNGLKNIDLISPLFLPSVKGA